MTTFLVNANNLSADVKKEAEGFLRMKVNMKLLQQHCLSETTGKVVTLKSHQKTEKKVVH